MTALPRDEHPLLAHLVASRIAGEIDTPRGDNLRNYERMAQGRRGYDFGLVPRRRWTAAEVLDVMVRRCGVIRDPSYVEGPDTIDPLLTLAALDRWRDRLALAAARRERVLLASGHPTGVLSLHLPVAAALRAAGAEVLIPDTAWRWDWDSADEWARRRPRHVRCIGGVHVLASGGELLHTHRPEPMRSLLDDLASPPDLVVADHGWAGAAAEAGRDVVCFADCNDPALPMGAHEGKVEVCVPLDDNVLPDLYQPLADYLVAAINGR